MPQAVLTDPVTTDNYARVLANEASPAFAFAAENADALRQWQQALREQLIQRLGLPQIEARCAAKPEAVKLGEHRLDDHVREEWEIETEPGFCMPFFLLRPLNSDGPHPLVLTPHGHDARGRFTCSGIAQSESERAEMEAGERDIALQAVRQGYVAIAPDARAFDGGRSRRDIDAGAKSSCLDWQMRAMMLGRTLIGERVWDLMRLIDYADSRLEIDTSRVMVTGNSGGGTVSLFAGAVDERIGVVVPGSYYCTFLDSIGSIHHCACNYVPGLLGLAEMADVAGLITPRPFLAVNGREDRIFPIEAAQRSFDALKRIYTVADAADRCELFIGNGGHRYYREPVWPFADKWL